MIISRLAAAAGVLTLAGLLPALPAAAHGAPTTPISRTTACASDGVGGASGGTRSGSAACKAARAANGGRFGAFDNLRLPGVDGNDRKAVPDGKLCSAGVANFRGLDLARDDFPATTVRGGETLRIRYRTTIPHAGTFRVYLTKAGYDPLRKLTWDDLGSKPIATIKDPPVRDGSYAMSAKLPDRTGRHLLYIVWQNSSTPDTYYSCSDLAFSAAAAQPAPARTKTKPPVAKPAVTSAAPASSAEIAETADPVAAETSEAPPQPQSFTPVSDESQVTLGHQIIAGALLVAVGAGVWALVGGLRRRRRENV
jgi:chitin-binding protein